MSRDFYTLEELVQRLGRDRRQVEKLVNRGVIPGRRIGGDWRFNEIEITHWLEQDLRSLDDQGLAQLEQSQQSGIQNSRSPIADLLHVETCDVPLDAGTRPAVLQALIEVAGRTWQVWDPALILKAVKDREDVMSTGFENGIAIPHPRNPLPDAPSGVEPISRPAEAKRCVLLPLTGARGLRPSFSDDPERAPSP